MLIYNGIRERMPDYISVPPYYYDMASGMTQTRDQLFITECATSAFPVSGTE